MNSVDTLNCKIIFSLRHKMTHARVNIELFSIQTLSKCLREWTSVSPLISSEVHVDYKWLDFPVNLSNLSEGKHDDFLLPDPPVFSRRWCVESCHESHSADAPTHAHLWTQPHIGRRGVKSRRFRSESPEPAFYHVWLNQTRFSVVKCCGKP